MCVFGLSDYLHEALLSGGLLAVFFKNKMCVFCLSDYFYEALLSHGLLAAIIRCAQVCLYCVKIQKKIQKKIRPSGSCTQRAYLRRTL